METFELAKGPESDQKGIIKHLGSLSRVLSFFILNYVGGLTLGFQKLVLLWKVV